ncbi:hypothetical protein SCP_1601740 [Sparassis crispa]|uniref:Uncharacterized protein n=1 Tax=Sparassis crispa TaxID=139825 RepID=A0A401H525_9APHY|nr:hypothetical protein SCP_1601740 [Sparassis crispa]GBE89512.1 hypothetical protein SCP_1601740 [Sparassis crispa]
MEKHCLKLINYACLKESPEVQLDAFKSIISLTTRFPGLRALFVRHVDTRVDNLWSVPERNRTHEWEFFRKFAIFCLFPNAIANTLEAVRPRKLGRLLHSSRAVVESLISICKEDSGLSKLTAVRSLAGILEMPDFWSVENNYSLQCYIARQLLDVIVQLIEDTRNDVGFLEVEPVDHVDAGIDLEGIDMLASATLFGVQRWVRVGLVKDLGSECWYESFLRLIEVLRSLNAEEGLKLSYSRAIQDWTSFFKEFSDGPLPESLPGEYEIPAPIRLPETNPDNNAHGRWTRAVKNPRIANDSPLSQTSTYTEEVPPIDCSSVHESSSSSETLSSDASLGEASASAILADTSHTPSEGAARADGSDVYLTPLVVVPPSSAYLVKQDMAEAQSSFEQLYHAPKENSIHLGIDQLSRSFTNRRFASHLRHN